MPKVESAPDPNKKKKKNKEKDPSKSVDNNTSLMKNDKKLGTVLTPPVVEAKTKAKSYLEQYRERIGVPSQGRIRSPEGSMLSVFGDTCQDSVSNVDSRPPSGTPRDDQSELSFYRRLIRHQPRTTRSYDPEQRITATNDWLKSVSDYGLSLSEHRRRSYRPYSVTDLKSLTVPRADRSLGPDTAETRAKLETLTRRIEYGDLASSRNRKNLCRIFELRKCRRTNARQRTVGFPLVGLDDAASERATESKVEPEKAGDEEKKTRRSCHSRRKELSQSTVAEHTSHPKGSPKAFETAVKRSSRISLGDNANSSSLEDLQRRHQNEKRIIDMMINRTLRR
ncbi:uncharacterized protein LOC124184795 [Neodiprion fabricii]|uniref:uncharacterized protein LOC124184795 n=1 Tax=Neodiprion fabricii TaxID=2872261 RepID=UPI001ED94665|nr:uncharacterized protein LOC124184795 [Neodiprion fabricii]